MTDNPRAVIGAKDLRKKQLQAQPALADIIHY
jgi:hypothetical protein